MKKKLTLVVLALIFSSCNPEGTDYTPVSVKGRYKLYLININGNVTYPICDGFSILDVKTNSSFIQENYHLNQNNECVIDHSLEGTFSFDSYSYGDQFGTAKFNNSEIEYTFKAYHGGDGDDFASDITMFCDYTVNNTRMTIFYEYFRE